MAQRVDHVATVPRQDPATVNITAFDRSDPLSGFMGANYFDDIQGSSGGDVVYLGIQTLNINPNSQLLAGNLLYL